MKTVKLSDAKNHLSRYVAEVQEGTRIRISVRGRPVVELIEIATVEPGDDWERELRPLIKAGRVRGPRIRPGSTGQLSRPGPRVRGCALSTTLLEDRQAGR